MEWMEWMENWEFDGLKRGFSADLYFTHGSKVTIVGVHIKEFQISKPLHIHIL